MIVSQVRARLTVDGVPHDLTQARVVLDETRVPYAQLDATVPYDPGTVESLDPSGTPAARVRLAHEVRYAGSITLADLTALLGPGATIATWTALWSGHSTLAAVTDAYEEPWNAGPRRMPVRALMDLTLRRRAVTRSAAEVTITAASAEELLGDYALLSSTPLASGPTIRDVVRLAVGMAVPGTKVTFTAGVGSEVVAADARSWEPGRAAWDWCSPVLAAAGYRLWCDERATWHLAAASTYAAPGVAVLSTTASVADIVDTIDRDATGYADAVVVTYRWTDAAGASRVAYATAGTGRKVLAVTVDGPPNGSGEAAARLHTALRKARTLTVTAGYDPTLITAMPATLHAMDGDLTATTTAVTWALPEDTTTITLRDIEES